jgi:ABC-type lipoprotein export system ATPase subunit
MRIDVNPNNKTLKKFSLDNLPDFLVITGENGSGKTQLLNSLSGQDQINPQTGQISPTNGTHIYDNNIKLLNINYVPIHGNHLSLGNQINSNTFVNQWGKLPVRYYSFLNLKNINPTKLITLEELITRFKSDVGINSNNDRNYNANINQNDLNLFEIIYKNKKNKSEPTKTEECIVNMPIVNQGLFSTNLTLLYLKHKYKQELGIPVNGTPWDDFNLILKEANFPYLLNPPDLNQRTLQVDAKLIDIKNNNIINVNDLSSGEKTIMSLVLALYNSKNNTSFPQVILFDEPDSSLHPSMSKHMLDVLQKVFIKEKNVKVIITTHSPTTVALSPELSIHRMDRESGMLFKEEKSKAIASLTKGLDNINIYFENRKQVFVESSVDKYFYENTYSLMKNSKKLNNNIHLEFITLSEDKRLGDKNGGCDVVKKIVNSLSTSGNNSTLGIIDFDNKNNGNSKISILGNKKRYSIENYILDPIMIAFFILLEFNHKKVNYGFKDNHSITNFNTIPNAELQIVVDSIISIISNEFKDSKHTKRIKYNTLNGLEFQIPEWFLITKGHILEEKILRSIYDLNSFRHKKSICIPLINKSIKIIPGFISKDILDTFIDLESK